MESKFEKIAERVITLALETAEYDEERAEQFLTSTASDEIKSDSNEHIPPKKWVEWERGEKKNHDHECRKVLRVLNSEY